MTQVRVTIMSCCGETGARKLTGWTVFICLSCFFAIVAAVNIVMMTAAVRTFGGVETGSSYQAGLVFARETSAVREQERLGWQVDVNAAPANGSVGSIEIVARDHHNNPLHDLEITARLAHPMDQRQDRALAWREAAPGVFHADVEHASGQWDLVIELSRDGSPKFRSRNRLTLR